MPIHVRNELQSPSPLWTQQGNYHWTHIEKKFLQQIINQAASSDQRRVEFNFFRLISLISICIFTK